MPSPTFTDRQKKYWDKKKHSKRKSPDSPVIRSYVQPKIDLIINKIDLPDDSKVLDVGAGNGYFSYWFDKRWDTTAIDYSEVILENNPVEKKMVMDARNLEFPDNSFDLVFCHAVLHHIDKPDRIKVINEMRRVSKKYVVMIEPNCFNPLMYAFGLLKKEERGLLDFSISYSAQLIHDGGLRVIESASWGALTPNRMPLTRLLLPIFAKFERKLLFGVNNIVIAEK